MTQLVILDVAHGNTSILVSEDKSAVFDCAPKDILLQTLIQLNIQTIDCLFLSHMDQDHVGGVINLLASNYVTVKKLMVNSDANKKSAQNIRLRIAIQDALKKGLAVSSIHRGVEDIIIGETMIDIIAPSYSDFLGGVGGVDIHGDHIDSNSMSAVILLKHSDKPVALFAADMDQRSLDRIVDDEEIDINSDILIFPHHGGVCGDDNVGFTKKLIYYVNPKVTIFSMGRNIHSNPRREVVDAIRSINKDIYMMCTQLSKNCLSMFPNDIPNWQRHLNDIPASGRQYNCSCAGSIIVDIVNGQTSFEKLVDHQDFIASNIPQAICRQ